MTTDDLLNLNDIGQTIVGYRFDLLDQNDLPVGPEVLHPRRGEASIEHDTTRGVMRMLRGLVIEPDELAVVDFAAHRVRPSMVLADGTRFPLGVYLFASATRFHDSSGTWAACTLVDKGLMIDQEIGRSLSVQGGTPAHFALAALVAEVPQIVATVGIDPSGLSLGESITWAPETHIGDALNDLGAQYGYDPLWFGHTATARLTAAVDPALVPATLDYDLYPRAYERSIVTTDDLFEAANEWIVVDSSNAELALRGAYRLPDDHPNSAARRGFTVRRVRNTQGIQSQGDADLAAYSESLVDARLFVTCEFDGPPDPRHDTFDVVRILGENWVERQWSLELRPDGAMHHVLQRQG